jgi:hypothetical protein
MHTETNTPIHDWGDDREANRLDHQERQAAALAQAPVPEFTFDPSRYTPVSSGNHVNHRVSHEAVPHVIGPKHRLEGTNILHKMGIVRPKSR